MRFGRVCAEKRGVSEDTPVKIYLNTNLVWERYGKFAFAMG